MSKRTRTAQRKRSTAARATAARRRALSQTGAPSARGHVSDDTQVMDRHELAELLGEGPMTWVPAPKIHAGTQVAVGQASGDAEPPQIGPDDTMVVPPIAAGDLPAEPGPLSVTLVAGEHLSAFERALLEPDSLQDFLGQTNEEVPGDDAQDVDASAAAAALALRSQQLPYPRFPLYTVRPDDMRSLTADEVEHHGPDRLAAISHQLLDEQAATAAARYLMLRAPLQWTAEGTLVGGEPLNGRMDPNVAVNCLNRVAKQPSRPAHNPAGVAP